jgi:O-antigen ligase
MTAVNATAALSDFRRDALPRIADALAAAVVASLPWSTSATGILTALWLVATLPLLDLAAVRRELSIMPGALPVALVVLSIAGLAWGEASATERLRGMESFLRLLAIPVLFAQFRRSERGLWVGAAFLASATALLALAWAMVVFGLQFGHGPGVPVKDYVSQSGVFTLCIFALFDVALDQWAARRRALAAVCVALALLFAAHMFYVTTSRTMLVVIPVLFVLLGLRRLTWKGFAALVVIGAVAAAAVWASSSYVRMRITSVFTEVATTQATGTETSAGDRLAFWTDSLRAFQEAPIFGHGTGTISAVFRRQADSAATATGTNPHNQVLAIAIQLGAVGALLLIAMWAAHWLMFLRPGLAAFIGMIAVTQNIVGSLFNSHLMDFTQAWIYVFAVGVFGGTVLREAQARETAVPAPVSASA